MNEGFGTLPVFFEIFGHQSILTTVRQLTVFWPRHGYSVLELSFNDIWVQFQNNLRLGYARGLTGAELMIGISDTVVGSELRLNTSGVDTRCGLNSRLESLFSIDIRRHYGELSDRTGANDSL